LRRRPSRTNSKLPQDRGGDMPAKIVLVNEDAAFRSAVTYALRQEGLDDVAEFSDALAAMAALAEARRIELLITAMDFSPGRSNGASLVRIIKSRKPTVAAILVGNPGGGGTAYRNTICLPGPKRRLQHGVILPAAG